jgi:hypothetical protein
MLGFVRIAPGLVRGSPFGCPVARLRSVACDMPPPLRYAGCVRAVSVDAPAAAPGLARGELPGFDRVAPGVVRGCAFGCAVARLRSAACDIPPPLLRGVPSFG